MTPSDSHDATGQSACLIPVRVRTQCAPWPMSNRALGLGRISTADAAAKGTPGKAQVVLAHVLPGEDTLVCYRSPSREGGATASAAEGGSGGGREVVLRVPLCLAMVVEVRDTAISITLSTPERREKLRGMGKAGWALFSSLDGQRATGPTPGGWTLECESPEEAQELLGRLQMAGCILNGLQRRYQLVEALSQGDIKRVFKAADRRSGEEVAVKLYTRDRDPNLTHPLLEASILRWHRHPNIEEFRGIYEVRDSLHLHEVVVNAHVTYAIVSEFLAGGELIQHVQRHGRLTEERSSHMMEQVLSGLAHLHAHLIVHRDIKLESIVLSGVGDELKLTGFGLCAWEKDAEAMRARAGAPGYVAPEVIEGPLSCKADCFSSGAVMFALLTGKMPFPGKDVGEVLMRNICCRVDTPALAGVSDWSREVVLSLLQRRPHDRASAAEALQHPWFRQEEPRGSAMGAPSQPAQPPQPQQYQGPSSVLSGEGGDDPD